MILLNNSVDNASVDLVLSRSMGDSPLKNPNAFVCVATLGPPFGVRGAFRLKTTTENPQDILAHGPLYTESGVFFGCTLIRVENHNTLVVQSPACKDRTEAERLRGTKFYTLKTNILHDTTLESDTFYAQNLIGAHVEDQEGAILGTVHAIENYGASDILVIKTPASTYLQIAFIEASVPVVDLENQRVVVVKEHAL